MKGSLKDPRVSFDRGFESTATSKKLISINSVKFWCVAHTLAMYTISCVSQWTLSLVI